MHISILVHTLLLCNQLPEHFHLAKHWVAPHFTLPKSLAITILVSVSMYFTQYLSFCSWLIEHFTLLTTHPCCSIFQNFLPFKSWIFHLHIYTTFYSSIYPSVDIWAASTFWQMWITHEYTKPPLRLLSSLLDTQPEVGFLDDMVVLLLTFSGTSIFFSIRDVTILHFHRECKGFHSFSALVVF